MSDATETSGRSIATRDWLNADGERIPTGSPDVAGFRYTFKATGAAYERMLPTAAQESMTAKDRGAWAMGGLTKTGNIVNSQVNADDYDNSDPMPDVVEWWEKDDWREPGEGGAARGPKYDKDALSRALVKVLGSKATGDATSYRGRLDDRGYYAKVRSNPEVMAAYYAELGGKVEGGNTDALA